MFLPEFQVIIGSGGSLWAKGGHSGYRTGHSHYCGGGGGGGVIQVFSLTDNKNYTANSAVHTRGGRGILNGEEGLEQVAGKFINYTTGRSLDIKAEKKSEFLTNGCVAFAVFLLFNMVVLTGR